MVGGYVGDFIGLSVCSQLHVHYNIVMFAGYMHVLHELL